MYIVAGTWFGQVSCTCTHTWNVTCDENIILSLSNNPLVVYMNTEYVMLSMS